MSEMDDYDKLAARDLLEIYGEPMVYFAGGVGDGVTRTAIVTRTGPAGLPGLPGVRAERLLVSVLNDADDGISSDAIDTGLDLIAVAARIGGTIKPRRILKIDELDAGMMTLELQ